MHLIILFGVFLIILDFSIMIIYIKIILIIIVITN